MGMQDDFVLRQIEMITRFVANIIFNKREGDIEYTLEGNIDNTNTLTDLDLLYLELCRMIRERKIGEAEDKLFENLEFSDNFTKLACDFYTRLNQLSDAELEEADFSRTEVYDGYVDIMGLLGIPVEQFNRRERENE